ncbi:hypothetical protein MYAM1_003498 [Malassezia yamatoensis]|uniref:Signal peptidase complex subunit 2 n=1 Tax=Malassezia yamatoensis TaxID=253288 RepID=A0AAJ5YWD0_9BASI|nr:hypothetical protein MYAM1_003498 [Malassezia yamatoensis]
MSDALQEKRLTCNTASVKDTKYFCDDCVERLLTQTPNAQWNSSKKGKKRDEIPFEPFQADHKVDDTLMGLSLLGSIVMLATTGYVYLQKVDWQIARQYYVIAVSVFLILLLVQSYIKYQVGPMVFQGYRTDASSPDVKESIKVIAMPTGPATESGQVAKDNRPELLPPSYHLDLNFTRYSLSQNKVLMQKRDHVVLGHFGEWFTESGEFVEPVFRQRLLTSVQRVRGD